MAFLLFFGLFALVFTAFRVVLAVPMVRFSSFFSPISVFFVCFFWGGVGGGVITFCRVRSSWLRSVDATRS